MAQFLKVTLLVEEEGKDIEIPTLINIECIESFRLDKDVIWLYYRNQTDKEGYATTERIKESAPLISEALKKEGVYVTKFI